jgi:acyl-coenzyme A thioesterase PaaI-like protein
MSQKIHPLKSMLSTNTGMKLMMNTWPPFLFAGIRILEIAPDYRYAKVKLKKKILTTNYVGTLFGGSLFAMTDPFYMIMTMKNLGDGYIVWDKRGEIEFVSPGKATVFGEFRINDADLEDIRQNVEKNGKYLKWFEVELRTAEDVLVAIVKKQIYFRAKP